MRSHKKVHISVIFGAFTLISHFYSWICMRVQRDRNICLYEKSCARLYLTVYLLNTTTQRDVLHQVGLEMCERNLPKT